MSFEGERMLGNKGPGLFYREAGIQRGFSHGRRTGEHACESDADGLEPPRRRFFAICLSMF